MKTTTAIDAILRSVLALGAASAVFVLVFLIWPSIARWDDVGRPSFQIVNHAVMLILGLAVGTVVMLICARRDFVTPALAGLALVALGLLGILMALGENGDPSTAVTFAGASLLGYAPSVAVVILLRGRAARRAALNEGQST